MKKKVRTSIPYSVLFSFLSIILIFPLMFACSGIDKPVTEVISIPPPPKKIDPDTTARNKFLKENNYTFTLAPEQDNPSDGYTRKEIESFLCACVDSYISAEEVSRFPMEHSYFIKAKKHVENERQSAYKHVINKWFEDKVTVTARGKVTILDKKVIQRFYKKINQVIGQEKFIFKPELKMANIIVEFAPPDNSLNVHQFLGETSLLQDNLRVSMGIKNTQIELDIYSSSIGSLIMNSHEIDFTPSERDFRKKNRLVKTLLQNILDPRVRHFALVHELLHTVGLVGHSPYLESQLFPLPVRAYDDPLPSLMISGDLITPMAEHMVEMLYRPDILPGMTIGEAAETLCGAKFRHLTPDSQIKDFLVKKKHDLIQLKENIIAKGKQNYDSRMRLYLELGNVEIKEYALLEEWVEIKKAYHKPAQAIDNYKKQKSILSKLAQLRRELILLESTKKKSIAQKQQKQSRQQVMRCKEEIAVVNDLIKLQNQAADTERKLNAMRGSGDRKEMEIQLSRIIRQLEVIDKELASLS